ncbi:hypothetical protein NDU88_006940 [Pleurodeles waltl]|uniref:Secreted protein n=1 Tax=Pleurodeles waltl TaxID=8319 RepID=A0AAV7TZU4_PLEWA|nr:hypothetical protein NDU88_006940 [Pleurodeles waltl]
MRPRSGSSFYICQWILASLRRSCLGLGLAQKAAPGVWAVGRDLVGRRLTGAELSGTEGQQTVAGRTVVPAGEVLYRPCWSFSAYR